MERNDPEPASSSLVLDNRFVISRGKEMPQYLKQNPSLLTKVVDYLVVCVNDFADAHGLSYPNAHEYLSKYRGLAFLVDCYEAEHLLSLDEALDDIRQICRQNGGAI